jgi:hypothetical protein
MLDLTKLAQQMQGMSQHLTQESAATRQRLEQAQISLQQGYQNQTALVALQEQWSDRLVFTAARPIEPLNLRASITVPPTIHTVLATDGSQIAPSHHEIAYCYLINIGRVVIHYGQNRHPLLDSLPEVFYRPDDLYGARQWGIRTEEWMGYRRTVSEAEALADLGEAMAGTVPTLALMDGSLIYWFLESLPAEARDRILPPILAAWERLRLAHIPLVGYVSASRSGEALNFLRLQACPYDVPNCSSHCQPQGDRRLPCQVLEPLNDVNLWATQLQPGQRSPLWRSSASILDSYGTHRIYFCYAHMGTEIARLELPEWVVQEPNWLETALGLTVAQVQKGYGYPVVLAEAHNQAVVRGGDRTRFFAMLEQQMIRAGLRNVGISYKEARKRGSIA